MTENKKIKKLVLIDANALIHRAFHALPPLTTQKGEIVNAVYGFILILLKMVRELKPDYMACAFDVAGPTFRDIEYKEYKAKRVKAPDALYKQIDKIKEVVKAFGIPIYEKQGFEADDIIGTIASQARQNSKVVIVTGDLDTLQLINKKVNVYTLRKGVKDTVIYDEKAVFERYGLKSSQMIDFKGLRGDPSDNIPGVPGVGEITAIKLLKEFGSIEKLYDRLEKQEDKIPNSRFQILDSLKAKLLEFKEQAFFSKKLVTIKRDVPIGFKLEDCRWGNYNQSRVIKLLKELGFYSLIKRIEADRSASDGDTRGKTQKIIRVNLRLFASTTHEQIARAYQEKVFSKKIYQLEKALVPVVERMEQVGVKVDIKKLKSLSPQLGLKIKNLKLKIYKLAGVEFNVDSPNQLSKILFEKLKIPTDGLKKTPGGVISTAAPELSKLIEKHPIIKLISEHRKLAKLKSTYIDALPKMIDPKDSRIHTTFHQLGTATGRFSSSKPNLQNIPIRGEMGKRIRECFVARKGFKLISADYSQIELRIVATLADDKEMIKAFRQGKDIHNITAAFVFGVGEEKITSSMRRIAKSLNFGIIYGMGPRAVAERAGISRNEAKLFIKNYLEEFKGVARFIKDIKERVKSQGYVETLFGRKRILEEINSKDPRLRSAAERMAVNMPVQGTAADIVKLAMLETSKLQSVACFMLLQVHDELVFEVKFDIIEETALKIKELMEGVVKLEVPLVVNVKVGQNWGEI